MELENIIEKLMDEVDILKATVEKDRQTIGSLEIDVSDLQQKVVDLDNNAVVMIGFIYLALSSPAVEQYSSGYGQHPKTPYCLSRNTTVDKFWFYNGIGNVHYGHYQGITISLPALYSLPNIRGLNIVDCANSFTAENKEDDRLLKSKNITALNAKYPGLFLSEEDGRRQEDERIRLYQLEKERKFGPPSNSNGR